MYKIETANKMIGSNIEGHLKRIILSSSLDDFSATGPWLQSLDTDLQMGEQCKAYKNAPDLAMPRLGCRPNPVHGSPLLYSHSQRNSATLLKAGRERQGWKNRHVTEPAVDALGTVHGSLKNGRKMKHVVKVQTNHPSLILLTFYKRERKSIDEILLTTLTVEISDEKYLTRKASFKNVSNKQHTTENRMFSRIWLIRKVIYQTSN
uniref:Uncharacterized protein n=1 Tax=Romanomermis culicivorax TaxID=13658 RepID=A0A915L7F3_ROMCU